MSEEIENIKAGIEHNRVELLNTILNKLGYAELDESKFQELLDIIEKEDEIRYKYTQALNSQEVIESVLKDGLI